MRGLGGSLSTVLDIVCLFGKAGGKGGWGVGGRSLFTVDCILGPRLLGMWLSGTRSSGG